MPSNTKMPVELDFWNFIFFWLTLELWWFSQSGFAKKNSEEKSYTEKETICENKHCGTRKSRSPSINVSVSLGTLFSPLFPLFPVHCRGHALHNKANNNRILIGQMLGGGETSQFLHTRPVLLTSHKSRANKWRHYFIFPGTNLWLEPQKKWPP